METVHQAEAKFDTMAVAVSRRRVKKEVADHGQEDH
jgi:hypothetical protein